MSDLAPFVAAALRDHVVQELMEENKQLRKRLREEDDRLMFRITGKDGTPIYYEQLLTNGHNDGLSDLDGHIWALDIVPAIATTIPTIRRSKRLQARKGTDTGIGSGTSTGIQTESLGNEFSVPWSTFSNHLEFRSGAFVLRNNAECPILAKDCEEIITATGPGGPHVSRFACELDDDNLQLRWKLKSTPMPIVGSISAIEKERLFHSDEIVITKILCNKLYLYEMTGAALLMLHEIEDDEDEED